jgi:hypothetical protein
MWELLPICMKYYSYLRNAYLRLLLFLSRDTDRTAGPTSTLEGSFDGDFIKEVPFEGTKSKIHFRVTFPKIEKGSHHNTGMKMWNDF